MHDLLHYYMNQGHFINSQLILSMFELISLKMYILFKVK